MTRDRSYYIVSVSVTLREELLELRFKGELFQFELRELQFTLLLQLLLRMLRLYSYTRTA